MKRSTIVLALSALLSLPVSAADEWRAELVDFRREADVMRSALAAKAAPTDAEVGDAFSFGRNVKWLGLIQSGQVILTDDCTPVPGDPPLGPDDRCVTLNPAPASTSFDLADIGRMVIPGRSTQSIMCHWLTPIAFYQLSNTTGVFQPNASFRLTPYIVVENEVLSDPALIDPTTGLPFGGVLESAFAATIGQTRSMQPGDRESFRFGHSRVCIAGFLSKRSLIENYGLTSAQATEFFKKDTKLRFGVRGQAALVSGASFTYGLRVMGD